MEQHEITQAGPLLDDQGNLREAGYARRMLPVYDRNDVKGHTMRIKEWDYYLVMNGQFALALTIADNSYMGLDSISLLDFWENTQITKSPMRLLPMGSTGMPSSSLEGDSASGGHGYSLLFRREEDQRQRAEEQASRRLSVFRVTQDGRTDYLVTECRVPVDVLHAATALRSYLLAKGNSAQRFAESLHSVADIAPEVFEDYADELRQGGGRVFAALDIDLDRGEFSALDTVDGWETYAIRDVSTAAWRATRKASLERDKRLELFAAHLEPRMIRSEEHEMGQPSGPTM